MQAVPQVTEQLATIGRVIALGTIGTVGLFVLLGVGAYLCMCAGACRQWSALDRRWTRPTQKRGLRYLASRLL